MPRWVVLFGVFIAMDSAFSDQKPDFDSLWNYDKPAETETQFRALVPVAQKSGDRGYQAELLTQIARTLGLQQKFAEAHALLDSVARTLGDAGERARVRYLLERGRVFNSSKQKEKATPLFQEAWERAVQAGHDFFAVDAAHMLAIATPAEQHMGWNLKAVALAEKSADPQARRWQGSLYNNIGWDYFDQKNFDSALTMFQRALLARVEQKQPTEIRIATWCVAKTLRMQGQADSALVMHRQLEKEWRATKEKQDGYVFEEIAECLLALNRNDDATPYFAQAYALLAKDPWLPSDEPERLKRLKELGNVR
ncbi:MAG: tetratricopeptide repeat protein [candidate division Zixibacteria bacterium]|nr:tetratricopeptide repeat protein [candidate division Zixibacteria bacterium]